MIFYSIIQSILLNLFLFFVLLLLNLILYLLSLNIVVRQPPLRPSAFRKFWYLISPVRVITGGRPTPFPQRDLHIS